MPERDDPERDDPERGDRLGPLLAAAARGFARVEAGLNHVQSVTHALAEGFFAQALTVREQTELSAALYDKKFDGYLGLQELMDWEERWLVPALPPAPARILVAAAGGGRECAALLELGYEVDGFDPAPTAVAHAVEQLQGRARVELASYADLGGPRLAWLRPSYDAVLLGWGSFSHVVGAEERATLFREVDALAGDGPVLASFYIGNEKPRKIGRASRAGRRLGRWIGAQRGAEGDAQVTLTHWGGFVRECTVPEIEALARSVSRRVSWHLQEGMPHVTMRRIES